ncbi:hypothetical protein NP493_111g01000 [Ridgeia piscesae]|uniref:Uncharacterized protein n=1 Tax=Ridgeia piscesae TaxID=27915 RepID=A0AAD9UH70_RIDPI|nr:hypothetical protein NP493_111g01000 [Ridgeia piscesae]
MGANKLWSLQGHGGSLLLSVFISNLALLGEVAMH